MSAGSRGPGERDPEYDRFGPWIVEISSQDPPPPLFVPHLARAQAPLLSLKVPRQIARRDAHPGMDLYDYVVSLYEDDLEVLRRTEDGVAARAVAYRDIQYLRVCEELLRGNLHLGLPDMPLDVPYNTVSSELIGRLVGLVRERYVQPDWTPREPAAAAAREELSFYFEGLLGAMRDEGSALRPIAAQAETALGTTDGSWLRRLLFGLVDKRLLESVHLSDGHELRVIDRGRAYAYRWHSVYGREETSIPLANISAVRWDEEPRGATTRLTVSTAGGDCAWVFMRSESTVGTYARELARLTGRP